MGVSGGGVSVAGVGWDGMFGGGGSFVTNVMANQSLRVEGLRRGPRVRR